MVVAPDDRALALQLAVRAIARTDKPYRFAINHDIRPPKNAACPLHYEWTRKDRCGIERMSKTDTQKWLTVALLSGYTVYLMKADRTEAGFCTSLSIERRRAEIARIIAESKEDDDIPF